MIRLRKRHQRHVTTGIPLDERHIAVGNLTGVQPSALLGYVLVALERDSDEIRISTDMCHHEIAATLASALKITVLAIGDEAHEVRS